MGSRKADIFIQMKASDALPRKVVHACEQGKQRDLRRPCRKDDTGERVYLSVQNNGLGCRNRSGADRRDGIGMNFDLKFAYS